MHATIRRATSSADCRGPTPSTAYPKSRAIAAWNSVRVPTGMTTEAWIPVRPAARGGRTEKTGDGLTTRPIGHLSELVARLAPPSPRRLAPSGTGPIAVAP